jgi:choline dehydrogenase
VPEVMEASKWPLNLTSERNWGFLGQPSRHLNGRSIPLDMGKVLGGGSSINAMAWVRGHKNDWDFFASEADDAAWNYESVSKIYRRIEDWQEWRLFMATRRIVPVQESRSSYLWGR